MLDELVTRRQNTFEPSLIAFGTLISIPYQTTYNLDNIAPNYGKARYLYTANQSNDANFRRDWVKLVSLEDLTEEYGGGDNVGTQPLITNYPLVARAASVYYDINRGNMIELAPVPQQVIPYTFTYEPATQRPQTKQGMGFGLDQFDALVAAMLAWKALLHCKWRGLSRAETREQRKDIREMLAVEIGSPEARSGLSYLFWQFNLTSYQTVNNTSIGFLQGKLY